MSEDKSRDKPRSSLRSSSVVVSKENVTQINSAETETLWPIFPTAGDSSQPPPNEEHRGSVSKRVVWRGKGSLDETKEIPLEDQDSMESIFRSQGVQSVESVNDSTQFPEVLHTTTQLAGKLKKDQHPQSISLNTSTSSSSLVHAMIIPHTAGMRCPECYMGTLDYTTRGCCRRTKAFILRQPRMIGCKVCGFNCAEIPS